MNAVNYSSVMYGRESRQKKLPLADLEDVVGYLSKNVNGCYSSFKI
jgi:hypothetical protein